MLAHALRPLADGAEPLQHRIDEVAVVLEMRLALVGDGVELLRALRLRGDVAGILEIGQRRVDDAGARRVPACGLVLQDLDDLVAVARLLGDQRERDQPQVALRQHAAGAHHVAAAHAVPAAPAEPAAVAPTPAAAGAPALFAVQMSYSKHGVTPFLVS